MIRLYNSIKKKKEIFKPVKKGEVKIYTCGPTVYSDAHIGNLRSYIFSDLLKRVFLLHKYRVFHVINVTDVGHLTSDADEGEDKIEKAAREKKMSAEEISNLYFERFKRDFKKLNLIEPNLWPKATENIEEQINLIKILEEKGFTYKTEDGIYFDTSKFKRYGRLSNKNIEKIQAGKRVEMGGKKNKTDFALWKFSRGEKREQEWESPWGRGFPGWHIECSAMAMKYLGDHFDIHTGGEDHLHIHHENEIAQSEAATGKSPWVNYWMHGAFLINDKEKMSKSKGNINTLSDLEKMGFSPLDYKFFTYSAHYRKQLIFSAEALESAKQSLQRIRNILLKIDKSKKYPGFYLDYFVEKVSDDLDIPGALSILWDLLRAKIPKKTKIKSEEISFLTIIQKMDSVLGLNLLEEERVPEKIKKMLKKREELRKEKKWAESDRIREEIRKMGWEVLDEGEKSVVKKIK